MPKAGSAGRRVLAAGLTTGIAILCFAMAGGCGSEAETHGGGATATGGSGGASTSSSDTGGDDGSSCGDAVPLRSSTGYFGLWNTGIIDPVSDRDFFSFHANEGEWLAILTNANAAADPELINPVLTLWDDAGVEQLAENDDALAYDTADSELLFRAPHTGSYCLQVWDWSDWMGLAPLGDESFFYEVGVVPLDFDVMEGFTVDSDPNPRNDSAQSAQSPELGEVSVEHVVGLLEPAADEDFYLLRPETGTTDVIVHMAPGGPTGSGSTVTPGVVRVIAADEVTVLAEVRGQPDPNQSPLPRLIYLPVPPGMARLYIQVTRPDDSLGGNDFYVLKYFTREYRLHQGEEDELGNDLPDGAELVEREDGDDLSAHVMGTLVPGDTDYWSFEANAGELLTLSCGGQRWGSGIRGMQVAVVDALDPLIPLEIETETDLAEIDWSLSHPIEGSRPAVAVPMTGTYLLQVDLLAGSQDLTVASSYYRCSLETSLP